MRCYLLAGILALFESFSLFVVLPFTLPNPLILYLSLQFRYLYSSLAELRQVYVSSSPSYLFVHLIPTFFYHVLQIVVNLPLRRQKLNLSFSAIGSSSSLILKVLPFDSASINFFSSVAYESEY